MVKKAFSCIDIKTTLIILSLVILIVSGCGNGASHTSAQTSGSAVSGSSGTADTAQTFGSGEFSTTPPASETLPATVSAAASSLSESVPETVLLPETNAGNEEIVNIAEALIGIDFAEGGASPAQGFDNAGFIYYVLRKAGYISCPRTISEQVNWGSTVGLDGVVPGDVVFFSNEPGGSAEFGGIYAGDGLMIYSPYPGKQVRTSDITGNYWTQRFVTAISF